MLIKSFIATAPHGNKILLLGKKILIHFYLAFEHSYFLLSEKRKKAKITSDSPLYDTLTPDRYSI